MISGAVARHYAQAVFELGLEDQSVERWRQDVHTIADYFGNRRLAFVLGEPNIPFARKRLVVRDLLGTTLSPTALNLALLLVERELVTLAPRIRDEFEQRYNDYHGQALAQLTTALPLDDATRARVRQELETVTGKHILLEERVDPTILGGAVARVGDTLIDGSVRYRLTQLRQQIIRGGGAFGGPADGRTPSSGSGSPAAPAAGPPAGGASGDGGHPAGSTPPAAPNGFGTGPAPRANEQAPRRVLDAPHRAPRTTLPAGDPAGPPRRRTPDHRARRSQDRHR